MMKKILIATAVVATALEGCAMLTPDYAKNRANAYDALNSWIGAPESALIETFGVPTSSYATDDTKILNYTHYANFSTIDGRSYTVTCSRNFTIKNKKISKWQDDSPNACFQ